MDARKAHKASSSSSPSTSSSKRCKYDVFLSFRGEDTRKGFTGHLHAALSGDGIRAFLDDNELKRAEFIKTQLEQAIHGSMISIIVFSKRYADSSWCLDELVKIMECRERLGQEVIPLFYKVEVSDVRKQTGSFAQAFEKHEAGICEGKHEKEKVQRWRNALTQAADVCGEDLKNADNGHEAKFIKKILGVVNKQLYSKYRLDIKHPVGITSRVKALSNHLDIENSGSKDVVRMIGIWGMGGIGKTTLAKAIYNEFEGSFEGRSFLANVREVIANQPITGLVGLQKQLLNDILKSKGIKVDSVPKGIEMIRKRLPCKRALVIIDDADDLRQLEAIAGAHDWFGPGTRIVITTRNQHLLEQVGVDSKYIAENMDEEEAQEFFSWHAFKRGYPDQEYLNLSKRVIHYCRGLPLALEVVGSFLTKRSTVEWENHLEKLKRIPDGDIQKVLRISFDRLPDDTTRKIFLDISCFFIGEDKDYVTQILDGCGFFATTGISVLIERCLVTVSEYNRLRMHDLLRDMGREIVRENAPDHLEKFSRLWKHEDVIDVLSDKSGTEEIEGVALHGSYWATFSAQAFTNMKKLRLLHLNRVGLTGEYKDFPKKLIWLCWHDFPLESIPDGFPMQPKLVALDLQHSELKIVWKDCKLHQNLKILNLSDSYQLTKSPDFSKLPNLEELILEGCLSLSEVHSSIGDLGRLSLVNLEGCCSLKDLPLNFYKSKSIETLILNKCRNLRAIPDLPTNLKVLKADGCIALEKMPDFSEMSNIRELYLRDSGKITEIPGLDKSLNFMTRIHMENCTKLTADFRKNILQGWTSCGYGGIFLSGNDIPDWFDCVQDDDVVYFTVPQSVGRNLKGLTLSFGFSSSSERISLGFRISIKNMTKGTELEARIIPDCRTKGYYLWQGQLSNDELKLQDGDKVLIEIILVEKDDWWMVKENVKKTGVSLVWDKFMNENMIDYHLCAYERRPSQNLVNDDDIIHVECDNYITKSPNFSYFPNLEKLILKGCKELIKVHSSIRDLGRLSLVNLEGCCSLKDLPLNFYKSKSIETLILNKCRNLRAIPDLPTNLKVLKADGCIALEKMPDFSEMSNIRELYLRDSGKITEIPGLDKSLNFMTRIHMENCTKLTADFRKNILQGWTSCGYGGIFLSGNDIPDWFDCVHDDDIVYFTVPQSVGRNLKGLTLSFGFSSSSERISLGFRISIKNMTKGTELEARIIPDCRTKGYYLWQGQLSNDELKLQDGDKVWIEIIPNYDWVKVKKTGVSLVWDKFMNENMIDYHLCAYERRPSQNLVNDDDIIHIEDDNHITKSPDFSKFPNLEKLILKGCKELIKVHSYIGDLERLSLVNLEGCIRLRDLPLNFYKSKSIETLILNGCWNFKKLGDGLGDMASLTILEADDTPISQIPSSIVKLKKLRILSLSGCWLSTEDAIPKDLCSLISLEDLLLGDNDFCGLPSLAGLSNLKVLCLNACRELLAIPDLPTNLYVLKANDCPELETIPDFSKMSNMRELHLRDSVKLTEVPGLDKSLNFMTRIHMEGCTNLTADFRNNILQRWTSCGFGGIYLDGIYDIPEWFKIVNDAGNIVFFEVPQKIMGRDLKGLTICFVYYYPIFGPKPEDSEGPIGIIVRNLTKQTALHAKMASGRLPHSFLSKEPEDLWQGQLSNDALRLEGGDHVSILVRPDDVDFVSVKKTGVHLEWDKVMKENMDNPDPHLYDLETNRDFFRGVDGSLDPHLYDLNRDFFRGVDDSLDPHLYDLETNRDFLAVEPYLDFLGGTDDEARPSHDASVPGDQVSAIDEESAVEDDPLGHGDLCTRLSLSIMGNLEFSGGADDGAGRSHGASNQSSAVDKQLEWDEVMKENMDNPDPHLYDLETNRDFLSLSIMENLDISGGADDGAGRSHGASNQSSAVDKQLEWDEVMKENMDNPDPHLYDLETNRDFLSLSIMENLDFSGGAD